MQSGSKNGRLKIPYSFDQRARDGFPSQACRLVGQGVRQIERKVNPTKLQELVPHAAAPENGISQTSLGKIDAQGDLLRHADTGKAVRPIAAIANWPR